jgi:threonine dehydratase
VRSTGLSDVAGGDVHLKLELDLPTGSFKVRGALHALTRRIERGSIAEVVAASTGNHGAAVAWAARELGVSAQIFVPVGANTVKTGRIRALGARLTETGADIEAARRAAEAHADAHGSFLLDDATNPDVPVGAGTIGTEIVDQLPNCATVIVPVGDSALIRGVAAAVKSRVPNATIVGVQSERAPAYYRSWHSGEVVTTETADTIADGLATTTPTADNVAAIRELVDDMLLVTEVELLDAIRWLATNEQLIVEPAAAAPVAAILKSGQRFRTPIVAILSGQNLAPELVRAATEPR